jgi:hypothetical protein
MYVVTSAMRTLGLLALLAPSLAAADVSIVKGGPPTAGQGLAGGALAEAGKAMAVCWRAPVKGVVRVAVQVDAAGAVTSSAISKGAAAQCAAGILAVWTVPGGAWKGEVEIGAAAAAPDLAATIQQQLLAASAPIKACQGRAPGKAGSAAIKLRIAPDGTIGDVAVTSKLGDELDKCVGRAVAAIKLAPTGAAAAVSYQLAIAFSGKDSAAPPPSGGDPRPPDGSVSGALSAGLLEAAVGPLRDQMAACGGKVSGKRALVRFTVRADGTVTSIVIKEPSGAAKHDGCIKDTLGAARFGGSGGETKVSLPLVW